MMKHRPLAPEYRRVSILSFVSIFGAFVLLLFVALSLPIVKPVYLLSVTSDVTGQPATDLATQLRFGVWGVCATSVLDAPTLLKNNGECFGPQLGYTIPTSLINLVNVSPSLVDALLNGLLVVLVLHPVTVGLSFVTLIASLFLVSHAISILALVLAIITLLVVSVVFAVDLALVLVAKSKVPSLTNNGFVVGWGNGVWMVLAALILTLVAVILLSARACYCFGVRRKGRY